MALNSPISLANDSFLSESYLVAAVLSDTTWLDELRTQVNHQMFGDAFLGAVWHRMESMAARDQPANLMVFAAANPDMVEQYGLARLVEVQQTFMGDNTVPWHLEHVREMHLRRTVRRQAELLLADAANVTGKTVDELRSDIEQMALETGEIATGNGLVDGTAQAIEWYEAIEQRQADPASAYGMVTGWTELDDLTLGFQRGDLLVAGGRTSVGKSAFALETVIRLLAGGRKVAIFSMEMSREQIQHRIAANVCGISLGRLRTGRMDKNELQQVMEATDLISRVAIDDERGVSADYIAAEMRRWKRTRGLDFVVVDYIQEIEEPHHQNDNAGSAGGRVARKLRQAAQKCDCVVMALSQLSRDAEGNRPRLNHLSGSAGIESAADVILLLHRDREATPNQLEVEIAKQRNGPNGMLKMHYDRTVQRLTSDRDTFRTT